MITLETLLQSPLQVSLQALLQVVQQFHFIRPYWLLLILPAFVLSVLLFRREKNNNAWQKHIDPALLLPLLQGQVNKPGKKIPILACVFWVFCALALAGPTWEKLPQPVEKRDHALVILMDLSPSMLAADVSPSRLIAAQHKILDLLKLRKEGYTALIAYSGDAHVVSPLTDDTKTVANLLNALHPGIMPSYGSNVEHAITLALQLFQQSGYAQGDILLVTDGITTQALEQSTSLLKGKPFTLSIIGVGTEEGGPIPTSNGDGAGGFAKNDAGTIILPKLHAQQLLTLAKNVNGYYSALLLSDDDIQPLVTGTQLFNNQNTKKSDREFDQWRDAGALLCLLLLPLVLATFRRGLLLGMLFGLLLLLLHPSTTYAADEKTSSWHLPSWDSLWLNDNQRAMKAMQKKDYENAAKQFKDPDWKASAQYEQKNYSAALKHFQTDTSTQGLYNQGNALAQSGKLSEAINAYNRVLKQNPQFNDAAFNKKIVEDLLKQQKDQPQKDDKKNDQQEKPSDGDNEQDKNSAKTDKSDSDQKNNNEQNPDQQDKAHQENDKDKIDQDAKLNKHEPEQKQADGQSQQSSTNAQEERLPPELSPEKKQALDQWLRQVPDDPSGLLRNKFEYYYQLRIQEQQKGNTPKQSNDEERW